MNNAGYFTASIWIIIKALYNLEKKYIKEKEKKYKNNKSIDIKSIYYLIKLSSLWISINFKQQLN